MMVSLNTLTQIVTVTLKQEDVPKGLPYTIRINPDVQTVKEYAEENPMVWVFVFYTGTAEEVDNWSDVEFQKIGSWTHRVVQPLYLGNVQRAAEAMQKYVDLVMLEDKYMVN